MASNSTLEADDTKYSKYTVCTYCRVTITPYNKLCEHVHQIHKGAECPFECHQLVWENIHSASPSRCAYKDSYRREALCL